ncbi:hypothetical protein BJ742DRAFT_860036 [Cladochytrium replicatum]|nr:hypothetical protein BJ742DRAFT_860036 [Cladochytrium replicatum]
MATTTTGPGDFVSTSKPTLFHFSRCVSARPAQLIYELGLDDEIEVRWAKDWKEDLQSEEYKKEVHFLAKVPAFKDGDFRLIESGAIFLYILDKYSAHVPTSLLPPHLRPLLYQHLFVTITSLYDYFLRGYFFDNMTEAQMDHWNNSVKPFLEEHIVEDGYLDSPTFTVLDIAVTYEMTRLDEFKVFEEGSKLDKYFKRVKQRESFEKAYA